jgi:hypothetical protein
LRGRSKRYRIRLAHAPLSDWRFVLHDGHRGTLPPRRLFHRRLASEAPPHYDHLIVFERTGMRLLLGDAQFREHLEDRAGFNFQFPSQLVDANFAHTLRLWRGIPSRARSLVFPDPSFST